MAGQRVLHLVANTHWDREWYLSLERYQLRLLRLFDRLVALLKRRPEFSSFLLDGQVSALEDYLQLRPEAEPDLRALIASGRLEIGPWYTQPHETMVGGEALVRNLQRGIRLARGWGGSLMISYNIDQFGHVSQMPQLLRGVGIADAVGWRGVPPELPSVFCWRGPDGSAISFFYSNQGYGEATALPQVLEDFTEVCEHTPQPRLGLRRRIEKLLALRVPGATGPHLLGLNGVDHAFAQEDLPEVIACINREFPQVQARQSSLREYVEAVKHDLEAEGKQLRCHEGELLDPREPIMQDAHSLRPEVKQRNRRLERLLTRYAEPFTALAWAAGLRDWPGAAFERAWKLLLQNQAHDSHACSSSDRVYRQVMTRFDQSEDYGQELLRESLLALTNASGAPEEDALVLCVFNPLGVCRDEIVAAQVEIPQALNWTKWGVYCGETEIPVLREDAGPGQHTRYNPYRGHPTMLPVQCWRLSFRSGALPGLGWVRLTLRPKTALPPLTGSLLSAPGRLENECLRVEIGADGALDLLDKRTGLSYGGLHTWEDGAEAGDGYGHRAPAADRVLLSRGQPVVLTVIRDTALEAEVEIRQELSLPSGLSADRRGRSAETARCVLITRVSLREAEPWLSLTTTIENSARDHRLRLLLPTGLRGAYALAGQPFDLVRRTANASDTTTRPFQDQLDLTDGTHGLRVVTDDLCEYELREDGTAALTVLRATDQIGCGFINPEHRMEAAQCLGMYRFSYALLPHGREMAVTEGEAQRFLLPPLTMVGCEPEEAVLPWGGDAPLGLPALAGDLVTLADARIQVQSLKRHDERATLVLRLCNASDEALTVPCGPFALPGYPVAQVWRLNLLEERQERLAPATVLHFSPRGLWTLELVAEAEA